MTALSLRTNVSTRDDMKLASLYWSIGMAKFESENFEDAMIYLGDFVKTQDAKKVRNVEYFVALQCIGDMHQHFDNGDSARTTWSASFRAYSSSKDMVSRYPELGPMIDRRPSLLWRRERRTAAGTRNYAPDACWPALRRSE